MSITHVLSLEYKLQADNINLTFRGISSASHAGGAQNMCWMNKEMNK